MSFKKTVGDYGEKFALKYLIKKGFNILDTHFSGRFGELDIVAAKDGRIHFIEVKTRIDNRFGLPEEALTRTKLERFFKTCVHYLYLKKLNTDNYQLDLIAIEIYKSLKKVKLKHYKAIQLPEKF